MEREPCAGDAAADQPCSGIAPKGPTMLLGATGLVGRHVAAALDALGACIVRVRRRTWGEDSTDAHLSADLTNAKEVQRIAQQAIERGCRAVVLAVHPTLGATFAEALAGVCRRGMQAACRPMVVAFSSARILSRITFDGSPAAVTAAEARLLACGLSGWVLRPTMIHGVGDHSLSRLEEWGRRGVVFLPGGGRTPVAPVHAWDVARAVVMALGACSGEMMRTLTLSGEETTLADIAVLQASMAGRRRPFVVSAPRAFVYPLTVMARIARGQRLVALAASYARAWEHRAPGHEEAAQLLAWEPMPLEVALRLTAAENRRTDLSEKIALAVANVQSGPLGHGGQWWQLVDGWRRAQPADSIPANNNIPMLK